MLRKMNPMKQTTGGKNCLHQLRVMFILSWFLMTGCTEKLSRDEIITISDKIIATIHNNIKDGSVFLDEYIKKNCNFNRLSSINFENNLVLIDLMGEYVFIGFSRKNRDSNCNFVYLKEEIDKNDEKCVIFNDFNFDNCKYDGILINKSSMDYNDGYSTFFACKNEGSLRENNDDEKEFTVFENTIKAEKDRFKRCFDVNSSFSTSEPFYYTYKYKINNILPKIPNVFGLKYESCLILGCLNRLYKDYEEEFDILNKFVTREKELYLKSKKLSTFEKCSLKETFEWNPDPRFHFLKMYNKTMGIFDHMLELISIVEKLNKNGVTVYALSVKFDDALSSTYDKILATDYKFIKFIPNEKKIIISENTDFKKRSYWNEILTFVDCKSNNSVSFEKSLFEKYDKIPFYISYESSGNYYINLNNIWNQVKSYFDKKCIIYLKFDINDEYVFFHMYENKSNALI